MSQLQLRYGSYTHPVGEVEVIITSSAERSDRGLLLGLRERWTIRGFLQAADQDALTTAINSLKSAYSQDDQTLSLIYDTGGTTAHSVVPSNTMGGIKIISPVSFPVGKGAEYSTYRQYEVILEAIIVNSVTLSGTARTEEYDESIAYTSTGGPRFVYLNTLQGTPVKQFVNQQTTQGLVQQGRAVGRYAYPTPSQPIWPDAEHVDLRQISYEAPQRTGNIGSQFTQWAVSWSYVFESAQELSGMPTQY